jgi:hypothetical protein
MDQASLRVAVDPPSSNGSLPHTIDVSQIAKILTASPVCAECIAHKTQLGVTQVDEALIRIRTNVAVSSTVAPCDRCLTQTVVHRIG